MQFFLYNLLKCGRRHMHCHLLCHGACAGRITLRSVLTREKPRSEILIDRYSYESAASAVCVCVWHSNFAVMKNLLMLIYVVSHGTLNSAYSLF